MDNPTPNRIHGPSIEGGVPHLSLTVHSHEETSPCRGQIPSTREQVTKGERILPTSSTAPRTLKPRPVLQTPRAAWHFPHGAKAI
ncbi:hypothetical protein ACRRTK_004891 [Alexandromys fortis]